MFFVGAMVTINMKPSKRRTIVLAGILGLIIVLLGITLIYEGEENENSPPPSSPPPEFKYTNKGLEAPPKDGIGARNGFGKKVDWWFLIKLPVKMMDPTQIQNTRLLPKDYLPTKPYAIYDDSGTFGSWYTKGYVTASIEPSLGFIQNWAPEEEMFIEGSYLVKGKNTVSAPQMTIYIQKWLGLANPSLINIKFTDKTKSGSFTLVAPKSPNWNKGVEDPSDKVVSVNLFRAWLRIKQAINTSPVIKIPYGSQGLTDTYIDLAPILTKFGLPSETQILLNTYLSKSGLAYDFANCGMGTGFDSPRPNYEGGILRCAHCVSDGNNPRNVFNDLPCTRKNLDKDMKCWNETSYEALLKIVQQHAVAKKYTLLKSNQQYSNCLTNWLITTLDGGVLDPTTIGKELDEINKTLEKYYNTSGEKLYDPLGNICFYPHAVHTAPGYKKIEKYTRAPPKPHTISFPRGPQCQTALDKDSPVTYFFPAWAKNSDGLVQGYMKNRLKRGSGLCYIYADSSNSEPRYFRSVKDTTGKLRLDPLGQDGNDPVSKTLNQLFNSYRNPDVHWSFWNDQMYQSGDSYFGNETSAEFDIQNPYKDPLPGDGSGTGTVYMHKGAGCSAPGAHSKGVVCSSDDGGFWLSTSIPMYPDFSFAGIGEHIKLGCQLDNNLNFAQHMFCCSMDKNSIQKMLLKLQLIMACSLESPTCKVNTFGGFNYGYGLDTNFVMENDKKLNMYQCSSTQNLNSNDSDWNKLLKKAGEFVYQENGQSALESFKTNGSNPTNISIIAKSPADVRPPWAIVANYLSTDLSVSGWWDNLNGTPSYCAGRNYESATNQLCLNSYNKEIEEKYSILEKNTPKYNVERIIGLTVHDIPDPLNTGNVISRSFTQYGKIWYVGNHAKWGISTPRSGKDEKYTVVFGDMNGGGYPAAQNCNSHQFGRGGLFFAIQNKKLHKSLVKMIEMVCACNSDGDTSNNFCGWGGYPGELDTLGISNDPTYGRIDNWDQFVILPTGKSSGSYWSNKTATNNAPVAWTRWKSPEVRLQEKKKKEAEEKKKKEAEEKKKKKRMNK